jgi:hypothetical protein
MAQRREDGSLIGSGWEHALSWPEAPTISPPLPQSPPHTNWGGEGNTKLIDLLSPIEALGHDRNLLWLVAERIVKSESLAVVIPDHQFDLRCAT